MRKVYLCLVVLHGGCTAQDTTEVQSFHSSPTDGFQQVVRIGPCTGTAYLARYVLTAAHCVRSDENLSELTMTINGKEMRALRQFRHPDTPPTGSIPSADLAIVEYEAEVVAGAAAVNLAKTAPSNGTRIRLVGFGMRGFYDPQAYDFVFNGSPSSAARTYVNGLNRQRQLELNQHRTQLQQAIAVDGKRPNFYEELRSKVHGVYELDGASGKQRVQKRVGYNLVDSVANGVISFSARLNEKYYEPRFRFVNLYAPEDVAESELEDNAIASNGDSGGPLFNMAGEIVGVASTLTPGSEQRAEASNLYVDLASERSKAFFRAAKVAGFAIPSVANTTALPAVDDSLFVALDAIGGSSQGIQVFAFSQRIKDAITICPGAFSTCDQKQGSIQLVKGISEHNRNVWSTQDTIVISPSSSNAEFTLSGNGQDSSKQWYRVVRFQRR